MAFVRVGSQVEQLIGRVVNVDEFQRRGRLGRGWPHDGAPVGQAAEVAQQVGLAALDGFDEVERRIDLAEGRGLLRVAAVQRMAQRQTANVGRVVGQHLIDDGGQLRRRRGGVEQSVEDAAGADRHGDARLGRQSCRPVGDQRHVDQLLIGHKGVAEVAVVTQPVAVVGDDDRQCVAGVVTPRQPVEQAAQIVVLIGDFGVVDVVEDARLQFAQRLGQRRGPAVRLSVPGAQDGARLLAVAEVGRDAVDKLARRPEGEVGLHQVEEEEQRPVALDRFALFQKGDNVINRAFVLPLEVGHLRP